jgi:cellulose synthase (UDP-forming)
MTQSELWEGFETGRGPFFRLLRWGFIIFGVAVMIFFASLQLTWPQQAVLGLLILMLCIWLSRASDSYLVTLTLMMMSMFATFRYACWRIHTVVAFFKDPGSKWGPIDAFFIVVLLLAEAYAFSILYLGFLQTVWPLRRAPVPLPDDPEEWPEVDLLIPTYNEPLNVVRYTALASLNIDWPTDKLHVYILDDGNRDEFREFAVEAGIGYMTRTDNSHAKAGNINHALKSLESPFVAIFDSDHVPTRSFLQMTMGWFFRDPKLAMLQTPHHFYSPDPFERNLGQFRVIPNEGELFYGIVQDGNDFWNASFFCGSCAVLRREALDEIGGIAVETVTEDAHTSLRMQIRGWNTAYINIPQAAGLATERLSGHVKQRIRWARGMIQILRTDNPLFAPNLKLPQRLCYFNAMTHFLYALPRLVFLTAPLIYLILGFTNVPGYWIAILAYALPHLTLSSVTNSRIQGYHRHSFWNEIYETVLSPYILLPTLMAMFNPKLGKFNVTAKGGLVSRTFFDSRIAQPFIVLLAFNMLGLLMVFPRFLHIPGLEWLWDGTHPGTIITNALWTTFNIVILSTCVAVAREARQLRQHVRIEFTAPVRIVTPDGRIIPGQTIDVSSGGLAVELLEHLDAEEGESLRVIFPLRTGDADLPATLVSLTEGTLRAQFDPLTVLEEEMLTTVLYSRADTWLGWGESREIDQPLRSLGRIMRISLTGLGIAFSAIIPRRKAKKKAAHLEPESIAPLLILALLFGFGATARAQNLSQQAGSRSTGVANVATATTAVPIPGQNIASGPAMPEGQFRTVLTLANLGVPKTIDLKGIDAFHTVYFSVPQNEVVKQATMHIIYHFSPSLIPALSHIKLMINGTLFATLPVPEKASEDEMQQADLNLPADLLVRNNTLTMEFIGHYTMTCEDPANTVLWAQVDTNSSIVLTGDLLPLTDDLKNLPLPFFDQALASPPVIPVVFATPPSLKDLKAAGIVTSYFGALGDYRIMRFPVSIGTIPPGNVVLIADTASDLPDGLSLSPPNETAVAGASSAPSSDFSAANTKLAGGIPSAASTSSPATTSDGGDAGVNNPQGPVLAIRTNPNDPYGKVLIVTGGSADQTIEAAQALAMDWSGIQGPTSQMTSLKLPNPRKPDDAPRWAQTGSKVELWDYSSAQSLQGDGSVPLATYYRLPPDLYFGNTKNVLLHLDYRYDSIPIGPISSMQVESNDAYLGSVPLVPGKAASKETKVNLAIPVVNLRPFSNSLRFNFTFQLKKAGGCKNTTPANMMGAILRSSYIDLRGFPHWAALPNLELFANAGFPFTRYADLSHTTFVLPSQPTTKEIELYLTLIAHLSAQTGMAGLRVTVAYPNAMHSGATTNFLVISTGQDNAGLAKIDKDMPVSVGSTGLTVRDTSGFFTRFHHAWWMLSTHDESPSGELGTIGIPDALIEQIESPFKSGRSIVIFDVKDSADYDPLMARFLDNAQSSAISGTVTIMHGQVFQSYRIGNNVFHVGILPWWTALGIWFTQVPWMVDLAVLAISFVFAIWIRSWLRGKARRRLQLLED